MIFSTSIQYLRYFFDKSGSRLELENIYGIQHMEIY